MGESRDGRVAAIYARISMDRVGAGLGAQRQIEDCMALCARRGYAPERVRVYTDNDISAYQQRKPRKDYERLLADIRAGAVGFLTAWHSDRLHRRTMELERFIDVVQGIGGLDIEMARAGHLDLSTPSGRAVARTLAAWDQHESEHKAERLKRKHQQMAEKGEDAGGGRPFGYEADRRHLRELVSYCLLDGRQVEQDEPGLVREAARRVLTDGDSLRSICMDWNRRGLATVHGGPWQTFVLRRILMSARISGRREVIVQPDGSRRYPGRISSKGTWPAIISAEDSDRLRAELSDPERRANRYPRDYLLTGGPARCGLCDAPLVARPRDDKRRSMVCARGPGFSGCGKIRVLAEPVEELVAEAVLRAVEGGALLELLSRRDDSKLTDELLAVEAKLVQLGEEWADGAVDDIAWRAAKGRLEKRRAELRRRVEAERSRIGLADVPDPLRPRWASMSVARKRVIVRALVNRVVVAPAVKGLNRFDPRRVSIEWVQH